MTVVVHSRTSGPALAMTGSRGRTQGSRRRRVVGAVDNLGVAVPLVPVDADPENPAYRNFTTDLGTAEDLWYRIVFLDADPSTGLPTIPVQNVEDDRPVYAPDSELLRILKIGNPSAEQETAVERVLKAASGEIDSEIDFGRHDACSGWELALAGQVAMERAAELWKLQEVQFGIVGSAPSSAQPIWPEHVGQARVQAGTVEAAVGLA